MSENPVFISRQLQCHCMSQTWKESARKSTHRIALEVATNDDGTYDISVNGEVVRQAVPERWLDDELCAKGDSAEKSLPKSNANFATVVKLFLRYEFEV